MDCNTYKKLRTKKYNTEGLWDWFWIVIFIFIFKIFESLFTFGAGPEPPQFPLLHETILAWSAHS
jgi:hypothetical protein